MKKICQLGLSLVFLLRRIKEEARLWRPRELPHPPQPLSFYFEEAEVTRSKEPSRNGSILLYIKKNHIKSRENPTENFLLIFSSNESCQKSNNFHDSFQLKNFNLRVFPSLNFERKKSVPDFD